MQDYQGKELDAMSAATRYIYPSNSKPDVGYEVYLDEHGVWQCGCPDFNIRRRRMSDCIHIRRTTAITRIISNRAGVPT